MHQAQPEISLAAVLHAKKIEADRAAQAARLEEAERAKQVLGPVAVTEPGQPGDNRPHICIDCTSSR